MILHIGTSKTGSTSLQRAFESNLDLLRAEGIYYPASRTGVAFGMELYSLMSKEIMSIHKQESRDAINDLRKIKESVTSAAIHDFDRSGCTRMILSDERFYGGFDLLRFYIWGYAKNGREKGSFKEFLSLEKLFTEIWIELKHLLKDFDIKVVCYLRRQDLWIESAYNQMIKENGVAPLLECRKYREFMIESNNNPLPEVENGYFNDYMIYRFKKTCYYENICALAEIFGKENIMIKPFEKKQFKQSLVKDFLISVLKINEEKVLAVEEWHNNKGLSRDMIEYLINHQPAQRWDTNNLYEIERKLNRDRENLYNQYFTVPERIRFLRYHKEGNERIASEFLNREDGMLFYEEIEKQDNYPGLSDETKSFLDEEFLKTSRKR